MLASVYFLADIYINCKISTNILDTFMVTLARNWENAIGISNMLFYLDIWPVFSADLRYPSSFRLLIIFEAVQ